MEKRNKMFNFLNFINLRAIVFGLVLSLNLFVLSGCHQIKEGFGLTRSQPDEFMVEDQSPLTIPPSFTLKPPPHLKDVAVEEEISVNFSYEKARKLLLKANSLSPSTNTFSTSEKEIAKKLEFQKKQENIRALLNQENKELEEKSPAKLFSGKDSTFQGDALKAEEEYSQRLKIEQVNDE